MAPPLPSSVNPRLVETFVSVPVNFRIPPSFSVRLPLPRLQACPRLPIVETLSAPPLTLIDPVNELLPLRISVSAPVLSKPDCRTHRIHRQGPRWPH